MSEVLHHAYIRVGDPRPNGLDSWSWVRHISSRDDDTGLDIWWFAYKDEDA